MGMHGTTHGWRMLWISTEWSSPRPGGKLANPAGADAISLYRRRRGADRETVHFIHDAYRQVRHSSFDPVRRLGGNLLMGFDPSLIRMYSNPVTRAGVVPDFVG